MAEFYEASPTLAADLTAARNRTWLAVVASVMLLGTLLLAIVRAAVG